jgi:hypothetical protein
MYDSSCGKREPLVPNQRFAEALNQIVRIIKEVVSKTGAPPVLEQPHFRIWRSISNEKNAGLKEAGLYKKIDAKVSGDVPLPLLRAV